MSAILRGHTIYLRAPTEEDALGGVWHEWYNDYEATRFSRHGVFPLTKERELAYLRHALDDEHMALFAVAANEDDRLVGTVSLGSIDLLNRKATVNIMIGSAEYRGTTAGLEAIGLALEHGFVRLNLHRIWAGANEGLHRWVRMLQVLGFHLEGTLRDDQLRDGRYADTLAFAVLEEEFSALRSRRGGSILCSELNGLMREITAVPPLR